MCALPIWGFWWIFPLVGMLICLGFFLVMFRSGCTAHSCLCMGGHRSTKDEAR